MQVAVVDDTQLNLFLIGKLVDRMQDARAHNFERPTAALEWCLANAPDLIIVDYMMPEMDGLEFIRRIRACRDRDDLPILMVTASHERDVRYAALDCGASDFLTKPVDAREFEARVRNMLKLRQAHLANEHRAETLAAEVRRATADILDRERETITRLSRAAEFRDPETGAHIQRMAHYSALVAARLGMPETEQELLLQAAPMHDVGKIGIPDYILLKPGKLSHEEFEVMKNHARLGHELLQGSGSAVLQAGAEIALSHHEKFDGSGYPNGLKGEAIPLLGRIVAVADVFDALTSERPYKKAWELDKAAAFLREGRGGHFDPACVDAFFAAWDEVPGVRERFADEEVPQL